MAPGFFYVGIVVCLVVLLVAAIIILFGGKKSNLSLIDLEQYTASLLHSRDIGSSHLMPPPPITGRLDRDWNSEEVQVMTDNRRVAQAIYKAAKENDL